MFIYHNPFYGAPGLELVLMIVISSWLLNAGTTPSFSLQSAMKCVFFSFLLLQSVFILGLSRPKETRPATTREQALATAEARTEPTPLGLMQCVQSSQWITIRLDWIASTLCFLDPKIQPQHVLARARQNVVRLQAGLARCGLRTHRLPACPDGKHACLSAHAAQVSPCGVGAQAGEQLKPNVALTAHGPRVDLQAHNPAGQCMCMLLHQVQPWQAMHTTQLASAAAFTAWLAVGRLCTPLLSWKVMPR